MGIRNFFFEKEDDKKEEQTSQSTPPSDEGKTTFARRLPGLNTSSTSPSTTTETQGSTYQSSPTMEREDIKKFTLHFDEVIENANIPAPNYYTFSRMLAEMGDLPDPSKFKGAFAALKIQGVSKSSLIDTANKYLSLLDQDNAGFKKAVEESTQSNQAEIDRIKKSINDNRQAITDLETDTEEQIKALRESCSIKTRALEDQIAKNQSQIGPLETETSKVRNKVRSYDEACQEYKAIIQDDINKINSLIQ